MTQLGTGVIGLGIGEQHVLGYQNLPDCELVTLCDQSEEKLSQVGGRYPLAKRTTRWQELIEDPKIQLISIASFDDAHCEQTLATMKAGKHVFVEKPLCCTFQELTQISSQLQRSGNVQLLSNLVLRAAPLYQWLRGAIRNGELGEIYAIDGDYLYGRIHKITGGWRKDINKYSVMLGGGIHLVDLMLWLTEQKPSTATSAGNGICTKGTNFQPLDFVSTSFHFDSGMIGRITANFGCVHRHQHAMRIFGTKATFLLDDQGPRLISSRDPQQPEPMLEMSTLPAEKWDLIPGLLDRITNDDDGHAAAQQEFNTISVCLAADESIAANRSIGVQYL